MYIYLNLNPGNRIVGDCTVRAIALAMGEEWEDIHADLSMVSHYLYDMPSSNTEIEVTDRASRGVAEMPPLSFYGGTYES